jgi:Nucleoside 2-deoxyribosyltransferase like
MGLVLFPATIAPFDGPLVFLAGPIQGAPHWQADAIRWFAEHAPTVSVASPRRQDRSREFDYAAQVNWETHYLRRAAESGVILFWLARETESVPGRAYAQTSRFELAEWKVRHERDGVRLVVGIEEGFSGERYIRHRFGQDCPRVPLLSALPAVCAAAAELAGIPKQA